MVDCPIVEPRESCNLSFDVGTRLRQVRQARGLTQRELARRADMTNGSLSMVEQGKVSPSIHSLERILRALPMSLSEFFLATQSGLEPVLKRDDAMRISKQPYSLIIHDLTRVGANRTFLTEMVLQKGAASSCDWLMCSAFLWGMVVAGSVELELDTQRFRLDDGDAFHFSSARRHALKNAGDHSARLIFTASPTSP